jgi:hypothetical protein
MQQGLFYCFCTLEKKRMIKGLYSAAGFILCLSLCFLIPEKAISQSDENWSEKDWSVECINIPAYVGLPYYTDPDQDCTFIKKSDDSVLQISEEEKEHIKEVLKSASILLNNSGFKRPHIEDDLSEWPASLYAGTCYCSKSECCEDDVFGRFKRPFTGQNTLTIRSSDKLERDLSAAHELFHACAARHILDGNKPPRNAYPYYWINEGGAESFGFYWARKNGISLESELYREYDYSLFVEGDPNVPEDWIQTLGYATWEFWDYISKELNSFSFMKNIVDKNYEQSFGSAKAGVFQVHEALNEAGYPEGLTGAYLNFVRDFLTQIYYFKKNYKKEILALDEEYIVDLGDIQPLSTHAGEIIVVPNKIEVEERESKKFTLSAELESEHPDLHLFVLGAEVQGKFTKDISEAFRTEDTIKVFYRVANVNRLPHRTEVQRKVKVNLKLSEMVCPLLPHGVKKLVYEGAHDGDKQLRVTYNLSRSPEAEEDETIDAMSLSIFSYELEKVIATAALDIECQEEGLIFQGMENASIAPEGIQNSSVNMNIATNTNLIPHRPIPGTTLPDASVVVNSVTTSESELIGSIYMDINSSVTDRKVISKETISVPAGTFECWRIEYNSKSTISLDGKFKMVLRLLERELNKGGNSHCTIWLAENHGWVKQIVTNNQGTSVFELVSVVRSQ